MNARSASEHTANATNRCLDISPDKGCTQTKHAIPGASEYGITARIRPLTLAVIPPIHLNDEPLARREKVRDKTPQERHLPPEHHAEPAPA